MVKDITIPIRKRDVYDEVEKTLEYIAAKKHEEGKSFEHYRVLQAQEEMLDRYWKEAYTGLVNLLTDYLHESMLDVLLRRKHRPEEDAPGTVADEEEGAEGEHSPAPVEEESEEEKELRKGCWYWLKMPSNYDEHRNDAVSQQIFLYYVYHIVGQWLSDKDPELMKQYVELMQGARDSALENLRYRKKPRREAPRPMHEHGWAYMEEVEEEGDEETP